MNDLEIVDVHSHALTPEFISRLDELVPGKGADLVSVGTDVQLVARDGSRRGPFPSAFVNPSIRIGAMDRDGVAVHVLSSPPFMFLYDEDGEIAAALAATLNDSLLDWARQHADRFRLLASLPLQDVGLATAEILRMAEEPMVAGVAIGSNVAGIDLDDARFEPLWRALTDADLPALIHPVDPPGRRLGRYFLRNLVGNPIDTTIAAACLIFGGVLERYPDLRVCLVHGGGFLPYQIGRLNRGYEHRPDARELISKAPQEFMGQLFFDTILHDLRASEFMFDQVGSGQIVAGSDYPFEMGDLALRQTLLGLGLGQSQLQQVASGNARRFLRGFG